MRQQIAQESGDPCMEMFTLGELENYSDTCTAPRRDIHAALIRYVRRHHLRRGNGIVLDRLLKSMFPTGELPVCALETPFTRSAAELHRALDAHIRRGGFERGL